MSSEIKNNFSNLFYEVNYDFLPGQSNIYGVSCFKNASLRANQVLIGLLDGRLFALEYSKPSSDDCAKCSCREIAFTYIPGKCHVISIDSFSCAARGLIIGVTFRKETSENFLNIYCNYGDDVPIGQQWNLDHVAQNCRSYELTFTPYQLTHCKVKSPITEKYQTVFILLGSDGCFHIYAQGENEGEFAINDEMATSYFVELPANCSDDIPLWLEVRNLEENKILKRFTVIGFSFGKINAFLVNVEDNEITSSWSIEHDSPISQCQLFTNMNVLHLVVVSTHELAVVYCNVIENGFKLPIILEESDKYDCSTCCAISNIHFDDCDEILIGTYGRRILVYSFKFDCNSVPNSIKTKWIREFPSSVLKIKFNDLTNDGIDEMVVVTTSGVHILQANLKMLLKKCKSKLGLEK